METNLFTLTSPFYLAKRGLSEGIRSHAGDLHGVLLDVGCGTRPYTSLFPECHYIGLELMRASEFGSARSPDIFYDGTRIPFLDASVDSLLCSQVLEHVFEPAQFLAELRRVLKPGGRLLLTVPFVWDEHEQPFDYARYSSFGLKHLLESAGFNQLAHRRTLANSSVFIQLLLAYAYKKVLNWPRFVRTPVLASLSLPGNVAGLLIEVLVDGDSDLYLDNVALFERAET